MDRGWAKWAGLLVLGALLLLGWIMRLFLEGRLWKSIVAFFTNPGSGHMGQLSTFIHKAIAFMGFKYGIGAAIYSYVTLLVFAILLVGGVGWLISRGKVKGRFKDLVIAAATGVVFLIVFLVFGYGSMLWDYISAHFSGGLKIITNISLIIILSVSCFFICRYLYMTCKVMMVALRRKFPLNYFTEDSWVATMKSAGRFGQAELIERTEFYSVGLSSNRELLRVLLKVESYIHKSNPAYESYWTRRKKLEEEVRQEKK